MANRSTRKLMIITVSGMSYLGPHHGGCPLAASQQCVPQKPFSQSLVLTRILGPMFEHTRVGPGHHDWTELVVGLDWKYPFSPLNERREDRW